MKRGKGYFDRETLLNQNTDKQNTELTMRYFEYVEPGTLIEACQFLDRHEEAKILAGGVSLLVLLKNRLLNTSHLVNIKTVGGLNKIEWGDQEGIRIGALNRHRDIYYSPLIQKY